ncbi:MAG: hypothetical protein JW734_05770 [Candidatus Omnitrophica bacterium]|nr:hypothetical protein [Candidatus Omnitrophota bacterium]
MSNEQYLIVSYFTIFAGICGACLVVYRLLRSSFSRLIETLGRKDLAIILRKIFLLGILLPAYFAFFSVSFHGCSKDTYEKIIAHRQYLIFKNQEQITKSLFYISIAVLAWGFLGGALICLLKDPKERFKNAKNKI